MEEHHLTLKIFVGLAAIVSIWLDFRAEKRKPNADPFIEAADAAERHRCRYARWGVRAVQLSLGIYLLWTVMRFILT
ncbi:hypothetical protein [Pantoea sp. S62]|uniref:hypothetical protein n=1 Tax=Pantoea sp. S62 TaxID=2769342 RepID=UPI001913B710|nr:hypothetical protein [Pantoea sp. S62]MBK5017959.1 hypothetical protein [Pantoea sp. S62]